eukprot:m.73769 g.73769  ORF g.73769 m.73769 type:complete len:453 (+) comp7741_c0_seq1:38-1396(+)
MLASCVRAHHDVFYSQKVETELRTLQAGGTVLGINRHGLRLFLDVLANLAAAGVAREKRLDAWQLTDVLSDEDMNDSDDDVENMFDNEDVTCAPQQARQFTLEHARVGMEWVVANIVKPQTAGAAVPLLDLFIGVEAKYPDGSSAPVVGPVSCFHSYTWVEPVCDTFATIKKALSAEAHRERYVWWDIFCQNQHAPGDVGRTFTAAIAQVDILLFAVPNPSQPNALTRVWCLYEIMTTLLTRRVKLVLVSNSADDYAAGLDTAALAHTNPLALLSSVHDAHARDAADKIMLLDRMDREIPGGCAAVDKAIRQEFVPLLLATQLCDGAYAGNMEVVTRLVEKEHVAVDSSGSNGWTALHRAVWGSQPQVVEYLLTHGANASLKTNTQKTPLDLARTIHQIHARATRRDAAAVLRCTRVLEALGAPLPTGPAACKDDGGADAGPASRADCCALC